MRLPEPHRRNNRVLYSDVQGAEEELMIEERYLLWMKENVPEDAACLCTPVARAMKRAFPELLLMSGEVIVESGQEYQHTWLQIRDGSVVVDPTEKQFGERVVEYHATLHDESLEVTYYSWNCSNCLNSHGGYYHVSLHHDAREKAIRGAWNHWLQRCEGEYDSPEAFAADDPDDPENLLAMRQEIGPYVNDSNGQRIDWYAERNRPRGKAGLGWYAKMERERAK